ESSWRSRASTLPASLRVGTTMEMRTCLARFAPRVRDEPRADLTRSASSVAAIKAVLLLVSKHADQLGSFVTNRNSPARSGGAARKFVNAIAQVARPPGQWAPVPRALDQIDPSLNQDLIAVTTSHNGPRAGPHHRGRVSTPRARRSRPSPSSGDGGPDRFAANPRARGDGDRVLRHRLRDPRPSSRSRP